MLRVISCDSASILDIISPEIMLEIVRNFDCKTLLSIWKICKDLLVFCHSHLKFLLYQKLQSRVNFNIEQYTMPKLLTLYKFSKEYTTNNISARSNHSLILKNDGSIYSFGYGFHGQLGLGDTNNRSNPTMIDIPDIFQVSCNSNGSLALSKTGQVYIFGDNQYTPRLIENNVPINTPLSTSLKTSPNTSQNTSQNISFNISQVSCGRDHSLFLTSDGNVLVLGRNYEGQLGLNDYVDRYTISNNPHLSMIAQVSAGNNYSLALDYDGQVYVFGSNFDGQLGFDSRSDRVIPTVNPNLQDIICISAGINYSLALSKSGEVYGFGCMSNNLNALGVFASYLPKLMTSGDIVQISAGCTHSLVLTRSGYVYGIGSNEYGQLGLHNRRDYGSFTLIPDLIDIVQISAGSYYSLVLSRKGHVYGFGHNGSRQLGLGDNDDRMVPTYIMSI